MSEYLPLLSHFPPVDFAFAYGSGVVQQEDYMDISSNTGKKNFSDLPMLDLVFAVSDPVAWHRENMEKNPHHYSGLRFLGPNVIAKIQGN